MYFSRITIKIKNLVTKIKTFSNYEKYKRNFRKI